jgi:hypothetical protein
MYRDREGRSVKERFATSRSKAAVAAGRMSKMDEQDG